MPWRPGSAALILGASLLAGAAEPWCDRDLAGDTGPIPVRCWLPPAPSGALPVVVFSHGLGGSREGYAFLARAWRDAGYAVILPTHVGSDTATMRAAGAAWRQAMDRAKRDPVNLRRRPREIACILDRLDDLGTRLPGAPHFDHQRIVIAGHSFGAWTALTVAGLRSAVLGDQSDPRPRACIALSPPGPSPTTPANAGAAVTRPVLVLTGTEDTQAGFLAVPGTVTDYRWRIRTFDSLASTDKWLGVLDGAHHSAFSGGAGAALSGDPPPTPAMTAAIHSLTTWFLDRCLRSGPAEPPPAITAGLAAWQRG